MLITGMLGLDQECMCAEVVALCLYQVGWQVLTSKAVVEAQSRAKSWCRNTEFGAVRDCFSPATLCFRNGVVEELVEQ